MKFWRNWLGRKSEDFSRGQFLDNLFASFLGGAVTAKSGAVVSVETALRVSTVLACVRVIAEGVAQVPFRVMKESTSSVSRYPNRVAATEHPLYDLLHRRPNDFQTSFEFRETLMLHALLVGGAFVYKNFIWKNNQAQLVELLLLEPGRVTVEQKEDWSLVYKVRGKDGAQKELGPDQIWHFRGPSWTGVAGLDMLKLAREAIGLAISTEESHSSLHRDGVRPSGTYTVKEVLDENQKERLYSWVRRQAGAQKAGSVLIMDRDAKFTSTAMTGVDAQHLETRRLQVEEVCRFWRVLPLMVGYSDKAQTYATAEQLFLAHVVHTLMPWYERLQTSAEVNLLTPQERAAGFYIKLSETALLRGALRDTAEYLRTLTQAGVMSRNEARDKLDFNPLEGLDEPLTATNMTTNPTGAPAAELGTP